MKNLICDLLLGLTALPIGFVLLWAGNVNLLDLLMLVLVVAVPMGFCLMAVKGQQQHRFDRW
jgi:hypothetical protein